MSEYKSQHKHQHNSSHKKQGLNQDIEEGELALLYNDSEYHSASRLGTVVSCVIAF
ncbi:hypothetical protein [Shewanella baltica]|uniref:hypothetical protein n=1 Tax=Shewanella baltica TaxID=62322 RepID=UPI000DF96D00|nr:hypothetical protein [Shewanella baltica]SUI44894.1 Uncharacterised protein [Shewanella baltica]